MVDDFAEKLTFVMKALLLSRSRLAATLNVDKSIVSRWCSGANAPSGDNLTRLTRLIGERVPGFTGLDWERSAEAFARRIELGGLHAATPTGLIDFANWLESPGLAEAVAGSGTMVKACAGLWRTLRPFPAMPGQYIREYVLMQPTGGGLMRLRMGLQDIRIEGWTYGGAGNQSFSCLVNQANGDAIFTIFHWRGAEKAQIIDGVTLSPGGDNGGHIYAAPCILERVADLTDDEEADEALYETRVWDDPLVAPEFVPPHYRAHLSKSFAPVPGDAGSLLTLPFAASLARGTLQPGHAPWSQRPIAANQA